MRIPRAGPLKRPERAGDAPASFPEAALPHCPAPSEPAQLPEPCPELTPSLPGSRGWEEGWGERGELLSGAV